jgi:hypothetical protein
MAAARFLACVFSLRGAKPGLPVSSAIVVVLCESVSLFVSLVAADAGTRSAGFGQRC